MANVFGAGTAVSVGLAGVCLISLAVTAGGGCARRAIQTHSPAMPPPGDARNTLPPSPTATLQEHDAPSAASDAAAGVAPSSLDDVFFDFDSAELHEAARLTLQSHARQLAASSPARVLLEGHCDERGTGEYNLALGDKRAAAAARYLASLGIGTDRVQTVSKGKEQPVCADVSEACRQRNRRVRFVVIQ